MQGGTTVSTALVRLVLRAAAGVGLDTEALARDAGLPPPAEWDLDGRMPWETYRRLSTEIADRASDDTFGLHVAQTLTVGSLGVFDYVLRNSSTLRESYDCLGRYVNLIDELVQVEVREAPDDAVVLRMNFSPLFAGTILRQGAEGWAAGTVLIGRQLTRSDWTPLEVRFPFPEPDDTSEHQALFRCPLFFDRPHTEIVMPASLVDAPIPDADPQLRAVLERYADELIQRVPPGEGFVGRVQRVLLDALGGGDPGIGDVAKRLAVSPRTLQRRLQEAGTSYQELVDRTRSDLARAYLSDPAIAINEVAFMLGFSTPSAFHRAFKRWHGTTPGEFRRKAGA